MWSGQDVLGRPNASANVTSHLVNLISQLVWEDSPINHVVMQVKLAGSFFLFSFFISNKFYQNSTTDTINGLSGTPPAEPQRSRWFVGAK